MPRSALNQQQSKLANRSLYFLLGMLSAGQHLEAVLSKDAENAPELPNETAAEANEEFLYLCLGLVSFSRRLHSHLEAERGLMSQPVPGLMPDSRDALSGALY